MSTLYFVLALMAFLTFVLATFNVKAQINLVALGLALWVLIPVIQFARVAF